MIECAFDIIDDNHFGFNIGDYDKDKAIVIDPLIYSSFLGGGFDDWAEDIVIDAYGNIYVAGRTLSPDLPGLVSGLPGYQGMWDRFVSKLGPGGDNLIFTTYLGGSKNDEGRGLAVDLRENVYIAGFTESTDFPVTTGAFQATPSSTRDGFITKLNANGSALVFSTFLQGDGDDEIWDLAIDPSGSVYVTGITESTNFPTSAGAPFRTYQGGVDDGFVFKLSANGSSMVYSSFLGNTQSDRCFGIEVDADGAAYVTGRTNSPLYPTTSGVIQPSHGGGATDSFITKINTPGTALDFSSFIGGSGDLDWGYDVGIDLDGNVYILGMTDSDDFPITPSAFQVDFGGGSRDIFICKLASDASTAVYCSYLGGSALDKSVHLDVDSTGNAYIVGTTSSLDFPTTETAPQRSMGGQIDAIVCRIDASGVNLAYSSYLGGSEFDDGIAITYSRGGFVYTVGQTNSTDFPITSNALYNAIEGDYDLFLCNLSTDTEAPVADAGADVTIDQFEVLTFDSSASTDDVEIVNWTWSFTLYDTQVVLYGRAPSFRFEVPGEYSVSLNVSDGPGRWDTDMVVVTVRDILPPHADAGEDVEILQFETVVLNASGSTDNIGITNWTWTFQYNGSAVQLTSLISSFTFDEAGLYTVTLRVDDAAGNWAEDIMTVTVIDIIPPKANAGGGFIIDQGDIANLNGTASRDNVGVVNWTWSFTYDGNVVELFGPTPSFRFDIVGRFNVTLRVFDAVGLWSTDEIQVVVRDVSAPTAFAGEDITVDQNEEFTLDGSDSWDNVGIVNWTWVINLDSSEHYLYGPHAVFSFADAGQFLVTLTVQDEAGNTGDDGLVVTVYDTETPRAVSQGDVQTDQSIPFIMDGTNSIDNIGVVNWTWEFTYSQGPISLYGATTEFTFDEPGNISIRLTVSDAAGNANTTVFSVIVRDSIPPVIKINGPSRTTVGDKVMLDATGSTDNTEIVEWIWTFTYNGKDQVRSGPIMEFTFESPGKYEIFLKVVDGGGNSEQESHLVEVEDRTFIVSLSLVLLLIIMVVIVGSVTSLLYRRRFRGLG